MGLLGAKTQIFLVIRHCLLTNEEKPKLYVNDSRSFSPRFSPATEIDFIRLVFYT